MHSTAFYDATDRARSRTRGHPLRAGAAEDRDTGLSTLGTVIERLGEVLDQETLALRSKASADLKDFNDRKSQGLLELNRVLRLLNGTKADATTLAHISELRRKLDHNRQTLKMHLEAVREVSAAVADAIREADSDGTYSPSIRGYGREP